MARKIKDPQLILQAIYNRGAMPWEEALGMFHRNVFAKLIDQGFVTYQDENCKLTEDGRDEILTDLAVVEEEEEGTVNPLDHEYRMGVLGIRAMEIQAQSLRSQQEYNLADKGLDIQSSRMKQQQANFAMETVAGVLSVALNVAPALLGTIGKKL